MPLEPDSNSIPANQVSIDRIAPQSETDQKSSQTPINPPLGPNIPPPPRCKKPSKECRPDQTPVGKHVLEVLAAGILAAYTVAAFWQLDAMRGQLGQMEGGGKQTDQMLCLIRQQLEQITKQATDTHDLAVAADKQARAAKVQSGNTVKLANAASDQVTKLQLGVNETSRLAGAAESANTNAARALEAQTRPWIGVIGEPEDIKQGDLLKGVDPPTRGITFTIRLKNYGQSPAMRVTIQSLSTYKVTGDLNKGICEAADKQLRTEPHFVQFDTIFPNSDRPSNVSEMSPFNHIFIVCIAYRGQDSTLPPHNTWVAYDFIQHPDANGTMTYSLKLRNYDAN